MPGKEETACPKASPAWRAFAEAVADGVRVLPGVTLSTTSHFHGAPVLRSLAQQRKAYALDVWKRADTLKQAR